MPPPSATAVSSADPARGRRRRELGAARRLKSPQSFADVLAADRAHSMRAAGQWVSMNAVWTPSSTPAVRFGMTAGKRNARRAVDRTLAKRILREAGRHAAAGLEQRCAARRLRLDVVLRLKAPYDASALSITHWRRALRTDAGALMARLAQRIDALEVPHA